MALIFGFHFLFLDLLFSPTQLHCRAREVREEPAAEGPLPQGPGLEELEGRGGSSEDRR